MKHKIMLLNQQREPIISLQAAVYKYKRGNLEISENIISRRPTEDIIQLLNWQKVKLGDIVYCAQKIDYLFGKFECELKGETK